MGGIDRIEGSVSITPPIIWAEFKDTPFHIRTADQKEWDRVLWLDVEEEESETPEGTLVIREATGIRVSNYDELSARNLRDNLEQIIKKFRLTPKGDERSFEGFFLVEEEGRSAVWRLTVTGNGQVIHEKARMVWEDGTEVYKR